MKMKNRPQIRSEKGSLALEQVLFIGAVLTMSLGVFAFYDRIAAYLKTVNVGSLPTEFNTTITSNSQ